MQVYGFFIILTVTSVANKTDFYQTKERGVDTPFLNTTKLTTNYSTNSPSGAFPSWNFSDFT